MSFTRRRFLQGTLAAKTGIPAAFTPYGTNDELMNSLRASDGEGFDVIMPTVDRVPGYLDYNLI